MNDDIRIKVSFPHHPKTKKLKRRIGAEGVLCLITLWIFTAQNKPDGNLKGMSEEDIELAAGWEGDAGRMLGALLDVGFAVRTHDGFALHDWKENNPYAAAAPERSESARKAANARWSKGEENKGDNAERNAERMPDASRGNAPSPYPSPSPEPNKRSKSSGERFSPPTLLEVTSYCSERKNSVDPERWHDYYQSNGWMVGKNKMKDWKAAVRTWEKTSKPSTNNELDLDELNRMVGRT